MRLIALALTAVLTLSACDAMQSAADDLARDQAKQVVGQVVDTHLPGANVEPVTDCIIDNASAQEIVKIARAAIVGIDVETTDLVLQIAQRPETVTCIAEAALAQFL